MSDIVFVAIILAFFALAILFVRACDRIIGPEEDAFASASETDDTPQAQRTEATV